MSRADLGRSRALRAGAASAQELEIGSYLVPKAMPRSAPSYAAGTAAPAILVASGRPELAEGSRRVPQRRQLKAAAANAGDMLIADAIPCVYKMRQFRGVSQFNPLFRFQRVSAGIAAL